MKWKRTKTKEKKISIKQEDKGKQSKCLNIQKKSVIQSSLNSGLASGNKEATDFKKGRSCKQESNSSKETEGLRLKGFISKKSRKTSSTEMSETAKKSEVVAKRRRRTKIEMALSYEARSPHLLGHILEEVAYDCAANLGRCVKDKSNDCMKGRGSFWILDDDLIRSVQEKTEVLEEPTAQPSPPQQTTTIPVPLVGLKSLSIQRANMCLDKELDVATIGKTIIQVSHSHPVKTKLTINKEPSLALMQLDSLIETSGFWQQIDNVLAWHNTDIGLEDSVQTKDTGGSGAVVENIVMPANEFNTERVHKEKHLITEECATNINDALEDVAVAGPSLSSIQPEAISDDMHSGEELLKTAQNAVIGIEDELELDHSGDAEGPHLETENDEDGWDTDNSQPLNRSNAEGLTRLAEKNGMLYKNKEMITYPNITVERIAQDHFLFGNDDNNDAIQATRFPVAPTDISILNSVSLGICRNVGSEIINEKDQGVTDPSGQQEVDVHRMRRRKRKQLFTRRKKCKNTSKAIFPPADSGNSWSFQSSITEQVLSGCRLAESGQVMDISPEVESAASVLAMMSSGGRLFSGCQHGERRWDSAEPWQKNGPTPCRDFRQAGTHMCDICGHVFVDPASLRQHISEHHGASQKSSPRKQLRRKQTTSKIEVARTPPSATLMTHSATVKSCDSIIDGTEKQLQKVQNLECKVQQSGDQPATVVIKPATLIGKSSSEGDDVSQIVETDHSGVIANATVGCVTNNVKLNESTFDKDETALKDINLEQDGGTLQAVEVDHVELGGTAAPANARRVLSRDTVQDVVKFSDSLSNIDSLPQTNVAGSEAVVGPRDMVGISESETACIQVGNAKEILMDTKDAACNSKLIGQNICEPNQNGITADMPLVTAKALNAEGRRSFLVGSMSDKHSAGPKSSRFPPTEKQLVELVDHVVGGMKMSGSMFGSELPARTIIGSAWDADVCYICNHKFSNAANTRKHIRMTHNSYRPHKCETCGKAFPYPSSLMEHMTSHAADPQKLICFICGKVFVRQSGLRKHIKEQHESTRPHACNVCDKRFLYRCLLREHQRSHSEERNFKCSKCACVFKQTSNLLMHMKKRHYTCECPAGNCACTPKPSQAEPPFSCVVCSKTFHVRKQLEVHLDKHDGRIALTCQVCEQEFPNKFVLSKHRLIHQETITFGCEVCNREFLSKPALKSHRRTHLGVKPYQCESCGKQYSTKNSLKIHSIRHLEVLPYPCNKCNKKFALRTNLTKHMAIHTKEHVFVCCHCDETFYSNNDLKRHILQHDEQKTYACTYCSKKFLHQSNLKMHVVKHTGERPHSCGVCGRCFSLKANLRRHMQTHMRKNGHIIAESSIPIPGAYVVLGPE